MFKYRRRVIEIEAIQVTRENIEEVAEWCNGVVDYFKGEPSHIILPVRGYDAADEYIGIGNYIVKDEDSWFYGADAEYFELEFELA